MARKNESILNILGRGRLSEAIAWTCLECELNPGNLAAKALREMLKESLHLQISSSGGKATGCSP